jgi:hypothetical protein
MGTLSLNEFLPLINRQARIQEKIEEHLIQLEALLNIAMLSDDFYDFSEETLRNYMWATVQLLEKTIKMNKINLRGLFRIRKLTFDKN